MRRRLGARAAVIEEALGFAASGACGTVVFFASFNALLLSSDLPAWLANVLAQVPAIATTFMLSARFVFSDHSGRRRRTQLTLFFGMYGLAIVLAALSLYAVRVAVGHRLDLVLANLVSAAVVVSSWLVRFALARRLVFMSHLRNERVPSTLSHPVSFVSTRSPADSGGKPLWPGAALGTQLADLSTDGPGDVDE